MSASSPSEASSAHRRASVRSLPPLLLVVVSFFLPTIRVCGVIESPMALALDGLAFFVPWYMTAFVLATVTVVALWRVRAPSRGGWVAAGLAVGSCGLLALVGVFSVVVEGAADRSEVVWWCILFGLLCSLGLGVVAASKARRLQGWPAWTRLLLAYWFLALPLLMLLGLLALDGDFRDPQLGLGAVAVALGIAALGVVLALLFWWPRRQDPAAPIADPAEDPVSCTN